MEEKKSLRRTPVRRPSVRTGVGVSVPAPILPDLRARYHLLQARYYRPVADGAEVVGVIVASSCFSFTRKGYAASVSGRAANGCAVAAAGCSSRERERQRGGRLRVSPTSPGRRFPQGLGVSVPDFYTGQPTIPRRRQEVCACADRPAEAFFSFGPCTARFLFGKTEKKMGGALPSYQHS